VLRDLRTVVDATAATFHGRASPMKERELEGGSERRVDYRDLRYRVEIGAVAVSR
jgi:hypothetical protein